MRILTFMQTESTDGTIDAIVVEVKTIVIPQISAALDAVLRSLGG